MREMDNKMEDLNRYQIFRLDARNSFVETKNDRFIINKVHLEFTKYDANQPVGHRQTDHIHIYIDVPEFLRLAHEALTGALHMRAKQQRESSANAQRKTSQNGRVRSNETRP